MRFIFSSFSSGFQDDPWVPGQQAFGEIGAEDGDFKKGVVSSYGLRVTSYEYGESRCKSAEVS
jgi:hypothetical protein